MRSVQILRVARIEGDRLALFTVESDPVWEHIYREAAGVYWDPDRSCFKSTEPRSWGPGQWYKHIVGVVMSGLKVRLLLSQDTAFESDESDFEQNIKLADQELWR